MKYNTFTPALTHPWEKRVLVCNMSPHIWCAAAKLRRAKAKICENKALKTEALEQVQVLHTGYIHVGLRGSGCSFTILSINLTLSFSSSHFNSKSSNVSAMFTNEPLTRLSVLSVYLTTLSNSDADKVEYFFKQFNLAMFSFSILKRLRRCDSRFAFPDSINCFSLQSCSFRILSFSFSSFEIPEPNKHIMQNVKHRSLVPLAKAAAAITALGEGLIQLWEHREWSLIIMFIYSCKLW